MGMEQPSVHTCIPTHFEHFKAFVRFGIAILGFENDSTELALCTTFHSFTLFLTLSAHFHTEDVSSTFLTGISRTSPSTFLTSISWTSPFDNFIKNTMTSFIHSFIFILFIITREIVVVHLDCSIVRLRLSLSPRDIVTLSEISCFSFHRFCSSEQLWTPFRLAGILKICVENTSALGMFPQLSSLASSEPLI